MRVYQPELFLYAKLGTRSKIMRISNSSQMSVRDSPYHFWRGTTAGLKLITVTRPTFSPRG